MRVKAPRRPLSQPPSRTFVRSPRPAPPGQKKAPKADAQSASERVVYGLHAVAELLKNPRAEVHALYLANAEAGAASPQLLAIGLQAEKLGIKTLERSRQELDRLAQGGVHQGVVLLCGPYRYASGLADLFARAESAHAAPLFLALDGVTDPQNLGALVRSTYVLGGHGVVLPKDRAATVTSAASKAAAGATELLPIVQVTNLARALEELKERGVWLIAAVAPGQGGKPPWAIDFKEPSALVLGSEGHGLRPLSRKLCEIYVEIPMFGGLSGGSLNVSAAGAVLLYEALRQRNVR